MELRSLQGSSPEPRYTLVDKDSKEYDVHPSQYGRADEIDINKDRKITDGELRQWLVKHHHLTARRSASCDEEQIMNDCKLVLQGKPLKKLEGYHTYAQAVQELKDLSARYPGLASLESLGKTVEGRDIWALKLGNKNADPGAVKPGVVITGGIHSNEYMGVEVPLFAAKTMLEQYDKDPAITKRLDSANIWFIPMLNPDGHEYVRTTDPLWRKNRSPITQTACEIATQGYLAGGEQAGGSASAVKGYGIDLNRNFWDGNPEHYTMYRPKGDTPCSTQDDIGASDDITSEIYRGASADSENEVKAIKDLELNKANNIKGVIDFHAYGNDIFYPWGDKPEEVDNVAEYKALAGKMTKSISDYDGTSFTVMQGCQDYATSGGTLSFHQINHILSMTVELGASFLPDPKEIEPMQKRMFGAQMDFIDHFIG